MDLPNTNVAQLRLPLPARFILGVVLIVALSLGVFYLLLQPPLKDLGLMASFLAITAVISIAASYGAYRLGWMYHSPNIRLTLLGGYLLSSLLTFVNVWLTARLMFISKQHDLQLATVLLLFARGIAMALGYFLSSALTDRIRLVDQTAQSIAHGNLKARTPVQGREATGKPKDQNDQQRTGCRHPAELCLHAGVSL